MTSQYVIVILLVAAAVALVIRRLVRTARGRGGCGCCKTEDQCENKDSEQ